MPRDIVLYHPAGRVTQQRLHASITGPTVDLPVTYTWDNEGKMTSLGYPGGAVSNYSFDEMGRLGGMTDENANTLATATYGVAGELLSLWMAQAYSSGMTETRAYNSLMQMTRQTVTLQGQTFTYMDLEYRYPTGQNNGRITQAKDWMTGEEVTYTYDAVQRLVQAQTTADAQSGGWGTAYGYDGFGNLWSKTTTKGSAPPLSVTYDRTTNRQYGVNYDANGNPLTVNGAAATWDVENRLAGWAYDPWNRRGPAADLGVRPTDPAEPLLPAALGDLVYVSIDLFDGDDDALALLQLVVGKVELRPDHAVPRGVPRDVVLQYQRRVVFLPQQGKGVENALRVDVGDDRTLQPAPVLRLGVHAHRAHPGGIVRRVGNAEIDHGYRAALGQRGGAHLKHAAGQIEMRPALNEQDDADGDEDADKPNTGGFQNVLGQHVETSCPMRGPRGRLEFPPVGQARPVLPRGPWRLVIKTIVIDSYGIDE